MKDKLVAVLTVVILLYPVGLYALTPISALYGTWGFTFLSRYNDGTWKSEGGKIFFDSDGTGTTQTFYNHNGLVGSSTFPFTYSASVNGNGTITLNYLTPVNQSFVSIMNDTRDMIFMDGTRDPTQHWIGVLIKLKDTPYNLTDFKGEYNALAYEFVSSPVITAYLSHALNLHPDGSGGLTVSGYAKMNEGLSTPFTYQDNYTYATYDSPFLTFKDYPHPDVGTVSANGSLATLVQRGRDAAGKRGAYGLYLGLKRESRTYTTADLAGKWILVGFGGGHEGIFFFSLISAMHCDTTGACIDFSKMLLNGQTYHGSDMWNRTKYTVASDGTFGLSYAGYPAYAAAIGNDGNTLYINSSLETGSLGSIMIGLRCNECAIPMETYLPLILR
jgi:hypothetical protein